MRTKKGKNRIDRIFLAYIICMMIVLFSTCIKYILPKSNKNLYVMSLEISMKSWLNQWIPKILNMLQRTSLTDTMLHLHYRSLRDTINCPMEICPSPVNVLENSDYWQLDMFVNQHKSPLSQRDREMERKREREKHIVESKGIKEIIQHKKIQI